MNYLFPRSRKKSARLTSKEREQLQREREKAESHVVQSPKKTVLPRLTAPYTHFEAFEHIFAYHGSVTLDAVVAEAPELIQKFHPERKIQPHHPAVRNRLICEIQNYGWSVIYHGSQDKLLEGWDAVHIRPEKVFGYDIFKDEPHNAHVSPRTNKSNSSLIKGLLPCSVYDHLRGEVSDIVANVFVQSHYSPRTGFQPPGVVAQLTGCTYPAAKRLEAQVCDILKQRMGDDFEIVEKTMLMYGDTPRQAVRR